MEYDVRCRNMQLRSQPLISILKSCKYNNDLPCVSLVSNHYYIESTKENPTMQKINVLKYKSVMGVADVLHWVWCQIWQHAPVFTATLPTWNPASTITIPLVSLISTGKNCIARHKHLENWTPTHIHCVKRKGVMHRGTRVDEVRRKGLCFWPLGHNHYHTWDPDWTKTYGRSLSQFSKQLQF